MFNKFSRAYMPNLVTGRGSISFATTLGKKKIAVLGYMDSIKELAEKLFEGTGAEVRYITTVSREPLVRDLFDNLPAMNEFEPDMILAIGGGAVMDVAKGLHLFYENPEMSFEDSLKPFQLPELGKKAVSVFVPTTSGTGSETSSAAVFINEETRVKHLLLSNYLIPHFAVLDPDMVDKLPAPIQIATALDALCHAIEATTALNTNMFTKAIGTQAALDVLENLPTAVDPEASEEARKAAKEKLHMAATMAGMSITNAFTGIVHSYDHPGPAFNIPHGIVCGIMLPYSMKMVGAHESYACIARRLGYSGTDAELSEKLVEHIRAFNLKLGLSDTFKGHGIDEKEYFDRVDFWSEVSLNGMATKLSPANMDLEKSKLFFTLCYYGEAK